MAFKKLGLFMLHLYNKFFQPVKRYRNMKKIIFLTLFISSPVFSASLLGPFEDKRNCETFKAPKEWNLKSIKCVFVRGAWHLELP